MIEQEQLICPVCSEYFNVPVTIHCGHTFCRHCLIQSVKIKAICPICRGIFLGQSKDLKQNIIISNLVKRNHKPKQQQQKLQQKNVNNNSVQKKYVQNRLLLTIQSKSLILPYCKTNIKFILSHSILLKELHNVVLHQNIPEIKYQVYGRVLEAKQNARIIGLYEGVFQAISFFQIQQSKLVEAKAEDQDYSVQVCSGHQIKNKVDLSLSDFSHFFSIFDNIRQHNLLYQIYAQVDHTVMTSRNDPTALFYSILFLLRVPDQQKYKVLSYENSEHQIDFIDAFLGKFSVEGLAKNPEIALNINTPGNFKMSFVILIVIMMLGLSYLQGSL